MKKSCKRLLSLTLLAMLGLSACNGNVGNAGVKGGTQWLTGTEAPTELTGGNVGDFYFDVDDNDIYQLTDDGWVLLTNIKGDKGDTGAQGEKGDKGDTGAQGEKGDKGDTGAQGEKGDKGDTGAQGEKGDKGDTGAQGEKGDKGDTGAQGEKGDTGDTGAQGEKGDKGDKGEDGLTPYIGANGNWWIGDQDTGVKAEGKDGVDGQPGTPGEPGKPGENGTNGETPYIGENGNWWIGDQDTGVKAEGKDGVDGQPGVPGDKGDTGDKGEDGVSVENIDIEYGKDDRGRKIIIFTITYSDGRTEVIETLMPMDIIAVRGLVNNRFFVLDPDDVCNYKLEAEVQYEDGSWGVYEIHEKEIVSGYVDFYDEGHYWIEVYINGFKAAFEVIVFNQDNLTPSLIHNTGFVEVNSTYDEILVKVRYDETPWGEPFSETVSLTEVATDKEIVFDKPGEYEVPVYYKGYEGIVNLTVYDLDVQPICNFGWSGWIDNWQVELGTNEEDYINKIIGSYLDVYYYDLTTYQVVITEEMIDYSYLSFDELGRTYFTISYGEEGKEKISQEFWVDVIYPSGITNVIVESYNDVITLSSFVDEHEMYREVAKQMEAVIYLEYGEEYRLDYDLTFVWFDLGQLGDMNSGSYPVTAYFNVEGFELKFDLKIEIENGQEIPTERKIVDAKVANYNGNINITSGTSAEEAFNLIRENLKLEVEVFYNDGSSEYIGYNYENLWFASDVLELKEEGTYFVTGYYKIDNYGEVTFEFTYNVVSESSSEEVTYELGEAYVPNNSIEITTSDKEDTLVKGIAGNYNVELTLFGSEGSKKPVTLTITEDMVVYENVEFGSVGTYWMTIRGTYEGVEFGCQFIVKIIPDLSGAKIENTYKFTSEAQDMFGYTSLDVYDNGYGVLHDLNNWDTYFEIEIDEEGRFTHNNVIFQISEDGLISQYIYNEEPVVSYYWDAREAMSMEYVFYFYEELKESGEYLCTLEIASGEETQSATATVVYDAKNNTLDVGGIILQINEDGTLTMCE